MQCFDGCICVNAMCLMHQTCCIYTDATRIRATGGWASAVLATRFCLYVAVGSTTIASFRSENITRGFSHSIHLMHSRTFCEMNNLLGLVLSRALAPLSLHKGGRSSPVVCGNAMASGKDRKWAGSADFVVARHGLQPQPTAHLC